MTVRTRFAPSPTGYLHIGGVRTALFNWLLARQAGGQFLLRIDDTDENRNVAEALQPILDGFRWLGIDWDEGPEVGGPHAPYYQSQRQELYRAAVDRLLEVGAAYRDFARPEEIQAERAEAEAAQRPYVPSRRWGAENEADAARFRAEGRESVVRLKMPREGTCRFDDLVRGSMEVEWAQESDHVVQRADGTCLYHLANVVDDHAFAITHVVRAVEHLANTPRQIFIARSLGYDLPIYAHLPFVAEPGSKNKLSKRKLDKYLKHPDFRKLHEHGERIASRLGRTPDAATFNPVIVDFYREVGYLPDAILNYLLLLGWSLDDRTEDFSRDEMIRLFSLDRVVKAPASFDPAKLDAFQQRRQAALDPETRYAGCRRFLIAAGWMTAEPTEAEERRAREVVAAAGDRIRVAGDVLDYDEMFLLDRPIAYDDKAFAKRISGDPEAERRLAEFRDALPPDDAFDTASLEAALQRFLTERGLNIGQIIHALRVAVTGKQVGFGMYETLALLGRETVVRRIDRTLEEAARRRNGATTDGTAHEETK
ncbi:MAG TPA: glutamate--tRNA ligase [Pirellulaceae bacterium]|nr:glutamate--tRNA ligase [Pirellulaceae bacterium]